MSTENATPAYPEEGRLVTLPIKSGNDNFATGSITLSTKAAVNASHSFQSDGIAYAELRLIGLEVTMTADAPAGGLPGFEVLTLEGGGKIQALYGDQTCLLDGEGYPAGTTEARVSYFGQLRIIGLRDKAEIEKTNTISCTVRVFANSAATGTIDYVLAVQGVFNTIEDDSATQSD